MNVKEVWPFLRVSDMEQSICYYVDGMGFTIKDRWIVDEKLRWCSLTLGGATLMLQEFPAEGHDSWKPENKVGVGISLCFQCEDAIAIYRDALARELEASEPFVGNSMWVTFLDDPDGYRLEFESATDVAEETKLSEVEGA
jgi:catechol 2,3-dioxygenase-like lactoylglutathione lyase family enzyme